MHTPEVVRCNSAVVIVQAEVRLETDCPIFPLLEHDWQLLHHGSRHGHDCHCMQQVEALLWDERERESFASTKGHQSHAAAG
jgi:hypothetical protein